MRFPKFILGCIFIVFLFITSLHQGFAVAEMVENNEYVPMSLIEKAAKFYGEERWPGCKLISITPYFALDGTTNAYAVQFAKEGSSFTAEAELAEEVSILEEQEKILRENQPMEPKLEEGNASSNAEWNGNEASVTVIENAGSDRGGVKAYVPPGALEQAEEQREEYAQYRKALAKWQQETKTAANVSVLADQVGTVIIAARYDLYPLLERFDGVAPHIKYESKVKALAGIPAAQTNVIERSYYLGPLAIFHEIATETGVEKEIRRILIDPLANRVFDLAKMEITLGTGCLAPAPVSKNPVSPQKFWNAIKEHGAPPKTGSNDHRGGSSHTIPGVPYYHQDDYGTGCCGPCASAQVLGYWDDNGYGNLVDNGSFTTGHENELVYNLMRAEDYDPSVGTYDSEIEPGIEAVCNNDEYGNNLNFNVISDYSVSWTSDIVAEINANRPFVYFNWNTSQYPYWAHFTTGTGYNDDSGHLLYVHYNYPPDTPYELNWDNIPSNNEALYKVNPGTTPTFDCVWSEDFEGLFPGNWAVGENGASNAYWADDSYRAHNVTNDPSPPGGATEWSAYCADIPYTAPGPYDSNMNTWMIYGPFSTVERDSGEMNAFIWRYITDGGVNDDYVALFASIDGTNFWGWCWWGDYRSWNRHTLDLTDVYHLGNIMNQPQVWVAVWFHSDGSGTSEGAYVDDITIKLSDTICPTPGTPSNPNPSDGTTGVSINADLDWSDCSNTDSYDVYFGTSSSPPYYGNTSSSNYNLPTLNYSTHYYWKIVAKNDCGNSAPGPVWDFTTMVISSCTLDIDGNGQYDALTDGILILRYLFGFRGATLIDGAVAPDCTRCTAPEIEAYLADCESCCLDIDGNGVADALTDGILMLRYLFGFRGSTLIDGAVALDCTRCIAPEIEAYIQGLMP